jgi:uncharacterized cupredoxin-like copper-binding protein
LFFVVMLFAAACGAGSPASTSGPGEGTVVDAPASSEAEHTDDEADHADDEADHADDEADHADDEADHADDEAEHTDDEADHADDEAEHTDEAGEHDEADADRVVEVVLTEFAIEMSDAAFTAGETVLFKVFNDGAIEHEFRLSNAHRIEEHLESGHEGHDDGAESDGHHADGDVFVHLAAGEEGSLLVTFTEDVDHFTEAACLVPGHYEAEMKTDISIGA